MSCDSCQHAKFIAPPGWKPSYRGQEYPRYEVHIQEDKTGLAQPLWCTFYPEWKKFDTNHYCGQWALEGGAERAMDLADHLRERAEDYRRECVVNKELRRLLKKSREVSAKRLARLKGGDRVSEVDDSKVDYD